MTQNYLIDRASGLLDAQLLSSATSGTFTFTVPQANPVGTQVWTLPAGYTAILTIDAEQILLSGLSISSTTVTATIQTRGYNNTTAATHAAGATCQITANSGWLQNIQGTVANDDAAILNALVYQSTVTTVVSATSHTIAGDQTAIFVVGRVYVFKVASTWYRGIITVVSFGAGTTTITLLGDGLIGSGTVVSCGFEFNQSINKAVDVELIKVMGTAPASNPPSGYVWVWTKGGNFFLRDNSGNVRMLGKVTAAVSSSGGVLTLDVTTANFFECTLTENITSVSISGGADGEPYSIRFKQAAGLYTVTLGSSFRFNNTFASYTATATNGVYDYIDFSYNSDASKYDVRNITLGTQTSPTQAAAAVLLLWGDGSDGAVNMDGTNTYASFASKASSTYTLTRDVYATTFIVATGVTLVASGFRIFAKTSFAVNGTGLVHNDAAVGTAGSAGNGGSQAGGGSGGAGGLVGNFPAGKTGGAGGGGDSGSGHVGTAGTAATGTTRSIGTTPGSTGGAGGTNTGITSPTGTGGAGGAGSTNTTTAINLPRNVVFATNCIDFNGTAIAALDSSGAGGGGGGGAGSGNTGGGGGGGGGAGGYVWIASPTITVGASAIIRSAGGNGGNGGDGFNNANGNGGGGGGGGNGGVIILIYQTLSNSGSIAAAGGTGGTHGIDRSGNTSPSVNGTAGSAGKIYQIAA